MKPARQTEGSFPAAYRQPWPGQGGGVRGQLLFHRSQAPRHLPRVALGVGGGDSDEHGTLEER